MLDSSNPQKGWQLLADLTHELRTLLNPIISYPLLLTNGDYGDLNPEQRKRLAVIIRNGQTLINLLAKTLDAAQSEVSNKTRLIDSSNFKQGWELLSNLLHELRTPLSSIISYPQLLANGLYGEVNSEQQEALQVIVKNGQALLHLLNSILDLSHLEMGKSRLTIEVLDLPQLLIDVTELQPTIRVQLLQAGLQITSDKSKLISLLNQLLIWERFGPVELKGFVDDPERILLEIVVLDFPISDAGLSALFRLALPPVSELRAVEMLQLTIAYRLAKLLRGSLAVNRQGENAVQLTLTLPLILPIDAIA